MSKKQQQKRVDRSTVVNHFAKVVVGCMIMMWGVINLVHNFLNWRAFDSESSHWWVTICFVLLTGLLPVLIGIWVLTKASPKT